MKPLFNVDHEETKQDTTYSRKVLAPQYQPLDKKPMLEELFDLTKYSVLIRDINNSSVSEEDKKFLRFAAARHIGFNYSKIADYYAHADCEMQDLMEKSALVIIDSNDAIVNGYVKLSKNILQMLRESGEPANE